PLVALHVWRLRGERRDDHGVENTLLVLRQAGAELAELLREGLPLFDARQLGLLTHGYSPRAAPARVDCDPDPSVPLSHSGCGLLTITCGQYTVPLARLSIFL